MEKNDLRTELNPFEMLEELLWQDQFELIFPENEKQSELRLVYLMNDAVESFLVFVNAKMTGQYQPDYEGELEAELSREDTEDGCIYVLIVHQGDSVVTIFFEKLKVETHLYRYGDLGHFWVKGYEYLRQLEYRIAILHTKCEYLGADVCQRRRAKTGGTGTFSTFKLCLLSGSPGEIYRADGGCVGADGTGYFNHGRTGIGSRRSRVCSVGWHFIGSIMEKE
ncbi:MAG: DUF3878 family protein [Eubacterium ramulus]